MLRQLARGMGLVALGTATGQGVVLLATPYLARLHTPTEFGQLALMTSVGNMALVAGCLRYDLALPGAPDEDAAGLRRLCTGIALLVAVLLLLLLLGAAGWGLALPAPLNLPAWVALCVLLVGLQQMLLGDATRRRDFAAVGGIRAGQGSLFAVLGALPGVGLVAAYALSFSAALLTWGRARSTAKVAPSRLAARYRAFPLQSLPGGLLDVVGYSACIWIITQAYGQAQAGHFSQIQRLLGAPLMLLGMSLSQVLLRQCVDLADNRPALRALLKRLLVWLVAAAAATLLAAAMVGAPLLQWLLGRQWHIEQEFLLLVSAAVLVRACVSPLSTALVALRRFDLGLAWQAAYFSSALLLMPWVASRTDLTGFLWFFAAHEAVFYTAYLYLIRLALQD